MVQIKDNAKIINRTIYNREEMEVELIKHNKKHFAKALLLKAYSDKVYKKLTNDKIRNKLLQGTLESNKCDYLEVYQFL